MNQEKINILDDKITATEARQHVLSGKRQTCRTFECVAAAVNEAGHLKL